MERSAAKFKASPIKPRISYAAPERSPPVTHLKRLSEEEALLHVVLLRRIAVHVLNATVATVRPTMLFNRLWINKRAD